MLEFEILQDLEPNAEVLEIIKDYEYRTKNGRIKRLKATNLQFIEPIEYLITYPFTLTILEYKVNEIANKNFYIKEHKQKYNLKEIKQILVKLKIINFFQTRGAKMHFFEQTYERVKKFLKFFYKFGIQTPKKFTGIVGGNIL